MHFSFHRARGLAYLVQLLELRLQTLGRGFFAPGSALLLLGQFGLHGEHALLLPGMPLFGLAQTLRITLDVLGSDYRVCESFRRRGGSALPLPVHAFGGRQDDIAPERIEAWSVEADAGFTLDWFEGGHFFIRQQESQVLLALQRRLAQTLAGGVHAAVALA